MVEIQDQSAIAAWVQNTEPDVIGQPDNLTVLAALSGVAERLSMAPTVDLAYNKPYEVARQFATLDPLSGGRAA